MDKKLIAVLGGGLLVGAGVFVWYFAFGSDMVARDAAKKPIEQWEQAWHQARACMLGEAPPAADPADAIAIREMTQGELHCSLAELARPEGQGSGIDEIEDAWGRIETAWHALAKAVPDADKMGAQIRAIDQAEADLRKGAHLPDLPAPKAATVVEDLALGAPVAGTTDVRAVAVKAHAFVAVKGDATIVARSATDVSTRNDVRDTLRAWPDPSWGVAAEAADSGHGDTLVVGTIGPDGVIADVGTTIAKEKIFAPLAAIGGGATRLVIVDAGDPATDLGAIEAYRSIDGGAHWRKEAAPKGLVHAPSWLAAGDPMAVPSLGTAATGAGLVVFDPVTTAPTFVATETSPMDMRACAAGSAIWYVDREGDTALARALPGAPPAPALAFESPVVLFGCTADAIAVRDGDKIRRCAPDRCDDGLLVPNHTGFADVYDGGGVVFAAQSARVIAVSRNGVDPVFVRAPADATLVGVAVWNKLPAFAFATPAGLRFATIP